MSNNEKIDRDLVRLRKMLERDLGGLNFLVNTMSGFYVNRTDGPEIVLKGGAVERVVPLLLSSVGASCWSTLKLTDPPDAWAVKDALAVARGIVEGFINVSYILAAGNSVAKKAEAHARQASYRDLNRETVIAGLQYKQSIVGNFDATASAELEEDLKKYTSKKGREIRPWTNKTIEEKLLVIRDKFGSSPATSLSTAYVSIYRHSSQILHGSYFGVLHFFGVTNPTIERGSSAIKDHCFLIHTQLIFCIGAVVYCWGKYYEFPKIIEEYRRSIQGLKDLEVIKELWDGDNDSLQVLDDE